MASTRNDDDDDDESAAAAAFEPAGRRNNICPHSTHQPASFNASSTAATSADAIASTALVADSIHPNHARCNSIQSSSATSAVFVFGSTPTLDASAAASAGETPLNARTSPFDMPGAAFAAAFAAASGVEAFFGFFSFALDAASALAATTSSLHSVAASPASGSTPGAAGGGAYLNPGEIGRTDVCAAPTWYAHATILSSSRASTSTTLLFLAMISACTRYAASPPGRSANSNVATRSQRSGSVTRVRISPRRVAFIRSPNASCSDLCTRGGGGPRRTLAAFGCHDRWSAAFPSSPLSPRTTEYASPWTAISTLVGVATREISSALARSAV
mmetsp:Transcript_3365/g.11326  ORF Transcript_3365/g.11326 Transcript_3365/m.11326 type:complete len:331 (-) Transcript_3365:725-1717(-)